MLELKSVTKSYNKNTVKAVDSLTMTVNNGEIFGFLGPNGAGKTTSIRMLTGILQADEGDLLLDGISIKERPIAAKRTFAFVPDNPETFSRLKAIEYLDFISDVYKVPQEDKMNRIKTYCEQFGMLENRGTDLFEAEFCGEVANLVLQIVPFVDVGRKDVFGAFRYVNHSPSFLQNVFFEIERADGAVEVRGHVLAVDDDFDILFGAAVGVEADVF